jgi:hypothetical protein
MGEVTRDQLEIVEAASTWHQHALFTLRVLRLNYDTLSPETKVQMSREIAQATQRRTDMVKALKLGERPAPLFLDPALLLPANFPDSAKDGEPQPLTPKE